MRVKTIAIVSTLLL